MARPSRADDDPISLFERLNADSETEVAALFRVNDDTAFLLGRASASDPIKVGRIDFARMKSHADRGSSIPAFLMREEGVQMAMRYYAEQFPSAGAIIAAAEAAPLRPTWTSRGPVRLAVEQDLLQRRIDVPAVQRVSVEGQPFFF